MSTKSEPDVALPEWVRDAIETGELMDTLPNKRRESRRLCMESFVIRPHGEPTRPPTSVRGFNIDSGGLGFIARREIETGKHLDVGLAADPEEPTVRVRVVHCTRTVQGYKIGCAFEPA